MGNLMDFVNLGGNVLLTAAPSLSESLRDFAYEFSIDYHSVIQDLHKDENARLVGSKYITNESVFYKGVGHALSGKNKLVQPLLVASDTAFMEKKTMIGFLYLSLF